ncbi:MAG: S1C family serine protease [Deinococcales bacterium]
MRVFVVLLGGLVCAVAGFLAAAYLVPVRSLPSSNLETVVAQSSSAVVSVRTDIANLSDSELRGVGSAFHIGDGYFVTAAHVLDGGSKIYLDNRARTVQHLENTEIATLVGKVDELDLALLRGQPLPTRLEWASIPSVVGTRCFAVGNPFARAPRSVTVGSISGLDRVQVTPKGALAGLLQFDAAVNPGNSGGALLNSAGEVLGVVSSILSSTGASAGVGFAISTQVARPAIEALQQGQNYKLRALGVSSSEDSAEVKAVLPGGLAAAAGVQVGDTLLEIDGLPIDTLPEANAVVAVAKAGSSVELLVKRNAKLQKLMLMIP